MTKISIGEVIPLLPLAGGRAADLRAVVPVRAESAVPDNVVPFVRPAGNDNARNAPEVVLPTDLARLPAKGGPSRLRFAGFVAFSLLAHSSLAAFLWHEPPPLASIGVEVISVELVLGATAPAGAATAPGETETQSASAPDTKSTETDKVEAKATEQPQDVQVAEKEAAPEVKAEQSVTEPPKEYEAAAVPQARPAEQQPVVAMVETPNPDTATAKPQETVPAENFTMLPPPAKATEKKSDPKPEAKRAAPPKPVKDAAPANERRRIAAPTRDTPAREAKASAPSSQANNVGVGRSSNDTNYRGLVAAHLARYKQYPADARSRGDGGTASVTFTIGGGGGVTSVRLAHGSGVASIDGEVTAMVRRASPFPPPPGGRAQSFTVPVSFRLN